MGRAPCCEKMGLKKGPWTSEEDQTLIAYIQQYGHGNWRALPKQAGLLRCGKSCRLRWTNYLRPDIKRGNFSREEEETIIKLHEIIGNRWSAMAAKLPGRTDNEIKNVWNTHLKKRVKQNQAIPDTKQQSIEISKFDANTTRSSESNPMYFPTQMRFQAPGYLPVSPQQSSSDFSSSIDFSVVTSENNNMGINDEHVESSETFPEFDENFWSGALPEDNSGMPSDFPALVSDPQFLYPPSPVSLVEPVYAFSSNMDDCMGFWYNLFMRAGELQELPEM